MHTVYPIRTASMPPAVNDLEFGETVDDIIREARGIEQGEGYIC